MSWRITTPSRLHFGMFSLPGQREVERSFGGCGLMIERPGLVVRATACRESSPSCSGLLVQRVKEFLHSLRDHPLFKDGRLNPLSLVVERAPDEHRGLGVGTQLGLAVVRLLTKAAGLHHLSIQQLTQLAQRGWRSAIGVYGFAQGGFIVEGGKRKPGDLSPLIGRHDFPEAWRVVVILPRAGPGRHGAAERAAFAQLAAPGRPRLPTEQLCRLTLLGMVPALVEGDYPAFGEALYEFNRKVGEAFVEVQGDVYGPGGRPIVDFLRGLGVRGVGQSSWGPALFAITADEDEANAVARRLRERFVLTEEEVIVSRADNRGAQLIVE